MIHQIRYAKTGKEFAITRELARLGFDVWCGMAIDFIPPKTTKQRAAKLQVPVWRPVLPNFIRISCTDDGWHRLAEIKHLSSTPLIFCSPEWQRWQAWEDLIEARAEQAARAYYRTSRAGVSYVCPYTAGEELEITDGPLAGLLGTFRNVVEGAKLRLDMPGISSVNVHPHQVARVN